MITGDQELQWAYLLCPTFELSNSEGKPLTNGYIELYIAGTRDKYYAASDFAGTLHPFQIPLDSLGSNIVLVSPDNAYDIYVYNRFGNLVMSRYNVVPTNGAAGGGSSSSNISIESGDGTVVVTESTNPETGVKTFDLSVPSVSGNPSFWTGRGAATMGVTISDTEYHKLDISNHSIRNRNDDITVVDGEFNLKKGVYFWNVTVQLDKYDGHDNTRQRVFIESGYNRGAYTMDMTHDETETISFSGITVADYDDTKQDIKIKSEGESPFKASLYNVSIHKLNQNVLGDNGTTYTAGDYIEITEDDVINVTGLTTPEDVEAMIDAAITALASGDIYTGGDYINITNHVISVTGLQPEGDYLTQEDLEGYATETYVDNSVSSFTTHTEVYESTVTAIQAATGAIPDQLEAGDYIAIIDNKINVTGLQEAGDYATNTEVYEAIVTGIQAATSEIPDVSDFTTHTEVYESSVTSIQLVTGLIPDVSDLATRDEVYEAVVTGVQLATSMIPDQLEAGDYISIVNNTINVTGLQEAGDYLTPEDLEGYATEEYVTTYVDNSVSSFTTHTEVYDATVTAIEAATAAIPDSEEVEFEEINLEDYALASAIPVVTGFATHTEVHDATVTAIEHVTALIPEAQVQSDWTEADTADPSYIQHKPEEVRLVAGDNVTITETATSVVISADAATEYSEGWGIDINNNTISVVSSIIPTVQLNSDDQVTAIDGHTLVGKEYTAGANIYIDNNEIGVTDVIDIYARPESASGMIKLGNIAHWGNIDYGPGLYLRSTMDEDADHRTFRWYITGDHGYENRFWGAYDDSRPDMGVSGESFLEIHEGDIDYRRGDFTRTADVPIIWSCSGMRYDIDRLQEAVTAIPAAQVQSNWNETDTSSPAYIQNKPNLNLYATDTEVYNAVVTGIQVATGAIPDSEEVTFKVLDLSEYALASSVPTIQLDSNDNVTAIDNHPLAGASFTQVQSNWTEADTADPSYIQNKPTEKFLVGGDNVNITETATSVIISAQGGGGSTYTAGNGIDITNDVISVDNTVAMASALPTTELGKFTIQNNVSGGPIEVIIPIDQGHAVYEVLMDSDSVSGTYEINGGYKCVLFNSPGYDNDYWNYTQGTVTMHVPEAITGISNIYACYASNSNPTGSYGPGPSFFSNYPWYNPDTSTYTLLPGDYEIATNANQVPEYAGGYGKYISVVANGPGVDINALSKISFAGMERHPELGYDVNLDRYALGNTSTISSTSGYPQALVYTDPISKKQSVYLPYSMPSSWTPNSNIIESINYGNSNYSPSTSNWSTRQYRAHKYTSSPQRYQFAYCTDWDYVNKLMTFVAYDNDGNAIEKWTLDYTTYGSNVWTTTPISSGGSTYTAGDYISIENDEIAVTGVGNLVAGNNITITESGDNITISAQGGGSTYTAGQYISIDNDEIAVTGLAPVSGSDGITVNNNVVSLDTPVEIVAGDNITISVTGASAIISAQAGGGTTYTAGNGIDITSDVISVDTTVALKTDIPTVQLNGSDQVTAINNHEIAGTGGGSTTYTAGDYISIANDVISVTGVAPATAIPESEEVDFEELDITQFAQASAIPTFTEGNCIDITSNVISWETTAGITDIVTVSALPANPVATVIYLIPEN